ncbi:MAG: conjugal transfer protein TraG N-terminal domain-containing protein [Burkholderiales bacterium]
MWEVYAYHNSDSLFGIFNAVAAIMGAGSYRQALAAVVFCGFVAAMVAYMFAPEKLQGWKWLVSVVLVYGVLFVPKVNVGIVDKTGGGPVKVVANVPFGMAALGSLTSTIGNSLTELFETAFQTIPGPGALPHELRYQQNGLMFGSRLIQETRRTSLPDPALRTDLINFVSNCTAYDIADGTIDPATFSRSDDVWGLMATTNPARFTIVTTATGVTTNTCPAVYASINGRLPGAITSINNILSRKLNPSLAPAAAQAALASQVTDAYISSQIASSAATATGIIKQNAMVNAINDSAEMSCQQVNDPSCMMLATGRASATAAQNAAWINGAKIAEQALPVVRNVAEALCYAVFPLIVLMLFLTSGRTTITMFAGYAVALVSIQLWPPLFAILNYMATIYANIDQAAAAEVGGGVKALSLQTAGPIYSNAISGQAVVSYLVIGIPMLAYAMANRLVNFGASMFGGLQGFQSIIGNASSGAALGNLSLGNVSMDQRMVTPTTSNPFVQRTQDAEGNWRTTTASGAQAISYLRNEGAVSNVVSSRVSKSAVEEASKAAEAAHSEMVAASQQRSSALVETLSKASSKSFLTRSSSGHGTSGFEEIGQSADRLDALSQQVAQSLGVSKSQVSKVGFELGAGIGGSIGIKAGADAKAGKNFSSNLTDGDQKIASQLTTEQRGQFKRFADRTSHDSAFLQAVSSEGRDGQELASRLSATTARTESAQASFTDRQAVAQRLATSYESGESISIDLSQLPANSPFVRRYYDLAAQYGSGSQALQIAMASELASHALPPTHRFSTGSALPSTFDEVNAAHNFSRISDPALAPGVVDGAGTANARSVRAGAPTAVGIAEGRLVSAHSPSAIRREISSSGAQLRDQAARAGDDFEARNEIVRSTDGTVTSKKSQMMQNARQLRDDFGNTRSEVSKALDGNANTKSELSGNFKQNESNVAP